jgi:hypothetical protein
LWCNCGRLAATGNARTSGGALDCVTVVGGCTASAITSADHFRDRWRTAAQGVRHDIL